MEALNGAKKNPDIEDASYVHSRDYYDGRDAGAVIRYLWRRPADKQDPKSGGWYSLPPAQRLGNSESFTAAADERTAGVFAHHRRKGTQIQQNHAPWATSYVHVVISPADRHDLTTDQLRALSEPWIIDQDGEIMPHVGAVHYDGRRGPHLHIAIARDRFTRAELAGLQAATRGLSREMRQEMEMVQEMAKERAAGLGMEMEI